MRRSRVVGAQTRELTGAQSAQANSSLGPCPAHPQGGRDRARDWTCRSSPVYSGAPAAHASSTGLPDARCRAAHPAPIVGHFPVPRLRVLYGSAIALGPGKAELLEAIARAGSISAAGRALGMSYRRAWLLVDTMNRCFREPLVEAAKGGAHGGGAWLTPFGDEVLAAYRALERHAATVLRPFLAPVPPE